MKRFYALSLAVVLGLSSTVFAAEETAETAVSETVIEGSADEDEGLVSDEAEEEPAAEEEIAEVQTDGAAEENAEAQDDDEVDEIIKKQSGVGFAKLIREHMLKTY